MFKLNLDGVQAFALRALLDKINPEDLYTDPKEVSYFNKQLTSIKDALNKTIKG